MNQEKLFEIDVQSHKNLLPKDGIVYYYDQILDNKIAEEYLSKLLETIEWKHDENIIFGKKIVTKRKVAWYGDDGLQYTYSNVTKTALPWTNELLELKSIIENKTNEVFNSCLLNLYHDGTEGMGWHSDDEKDLKKDGAIASLSFGAERKFNFKHKVSTEKISLLLEHGSLLVMKGVTQTFWKHQLPPSKKIGTVRVNLTFRMIEKSEKERTE